MSASKHEYVVTYDGDTMWLECDPCHAADGQEWLVCSIEPGDAWTELTDAVAKHEAPAVAVPDAGSGETTDGEVAQL